MAVKLSKVCSVVEVEDKEHVVFPSEIVGSIKPGSLDYLTKTTTIEWGENMVDPIESGTIPRCCHWLLLPASYKHSADDLKFRHDVRLYIHHTNAEYGSSGSDFFLWKKASEPEPKLHQGYICTSGRQWSISEIFSSMSIMSVQKVPQSTVTPKLIPITVEDLGKKIDKQGADLALIKAVIDDHKAGTASIEYIDAKFEAIRDLIVSHRAEAIRSEERAAAELASIKSAIAKASDETASIKNSLAAMAAQVERISNAVAPRSSVSNWR